LAIYVLSLPLLISPSATQKAVAAITAHDTPLAALAFNVTGTKLATASTTVSHSLIVTALFLGMTSNKQQPHSMGTE